MNTSFKSFLDKADNKNKTVLALTARHPPKSTFSYNGVDAITSASKITDKDRFFTLIDDDIQKIMSPERM